MTDPSKRTTTTRVTSLDVVRGVVMVLMAIDHVRVYSGLPAGGPTPGIFFTRWVTHFCAPAFVFLAGTGAFLHGRKLGDTRELARYLVTRGSILVLLEMTVIRVSWTFNFDYAHYLLAGVIWMLGWCMILLAGLVRLSTRAIAVFGLAVIFLQNVIGLVGPALGETPSGLGAFFQLLYFGGGIELAKGGPSLAVLYVIVPWIGVMAAGYAFGAIVVREQAERDRLFTRIGLSATAAFVVVAGLIVLMRPAPANAPPALFRFLGQQKYPASQLFLLMTLGPTIALLPLAGRARGWFADVMTTFGRVPMFYYLLHIPLIHFAAVVVSLIREGSVNPWLFGNHPMQPPPLPEGYRWSLSLLYLVFFICVAVLYFPCRWYAKEKARRPGSWMRFI
ncbi:MAG: DUF1624 domain-containing protein [Gemmatimonadales bacterium]